jgi:Xaa-Pro aminopeptidase
MDSHHRTRLTGVLDAEGLDALVATTPENLYYVTGFRSIAHALFRGLELYGVFTRHGTGLVIPFIDTTGVAAEGIAVDHLACYGKFFFEYADEPGAIGRKVQDWTRAPRASAPDALVSVLGTSASSGAVSAWTRLDCSRRRGGCSTTSSAARTWRRRTSSSGEPGWSRAPGKSGGSSAPPRSLRTGWRRCSPC